MPIPDLDRSASALPLREGPFLVDPAGRPSAVVAHASTAHLGDAVVLAAAAILVGLTARDLLDGPDAAPQAPPSRRWLDPRRWLRPARLVGLLPMAATVVLSVLVWTTPMRTWVWGVAALFGGTIALRPFAHGRRLAARPPTPTERQRLSAASVDDGAVRIVETARPTQLNGYTIGGPFSGTVGISRAAVETLPPDQLAAVVAHERGHHVGRHALLRAAASAGWLVAGAALVTAAFTSTTPVASAAVFAWVAGERLVAAGVGRATEYRADAYAARQTSPAAVTALLSTLHAGDRGDSPARRLVRVVSSHPDCDRRISRVERLSTDASGDVSRNGNTSD